MEKRRKRIRPTEIYRQEMAETAKGRGETVSFITNIDGKKFWRQVKDIYFFFLNYIFGLGLWAFLRMDPAKK